MSEICFDGQAVLVTGAGRGLGMLQREAWPGEHEPEFAPGVLFLASDRCTFSGVVLQAAGGRFGTAYREAGEEIDFGREPVEPETIADRWNEIEEVARAA